MVMLTKNSWFAKDLCSIGMEFGTILFLIVMLFLSNIGIKLWKAYNYYSSAN